jgi:hypothetical protein
MTRALLLALAALLAGCLIPTVITYYEPAAPGATISSNWCGVAGAPPNLLTLATHGVTIRITSDQLRRKDRARYEVFVSLVVPAGRSISFASDSAEWRPAGMTGAARRVTFVEFKHYDERQRRWNPAAATDVLPGSDISNNANTLIVLRFEDVEADRYSIAMPALRVDSTAVELPTVDFTKKRKAGLIYAPCG